MVHGNAGDNFKYPKIDVTAPLEVELALRVAQEGFYGGNPENVLQGRADMVLQTLSYIMFQKRLEIIVYEINKGS